MMIRFVQNRVRQNQDGYYVLIFLDVFYMYYTVFNNKYVIIN